MNRRYCQVCTDVEPRYSKTHHFSVLENYAQNTKTKTKISDMEISRKHACYQMFVLFCQLSRFVLFSFLDVSAMSEFHMCHLFSIKKNTKFNVIWASGVSLQFITLWTLLWIQHPMLNNAEYILKGGLHWLLNNIYSIDLQLLEYWIIPMMECQT